MNQNKFNIDDFFEMEKKYSLFDIKTKDNIYVWDIMRYDIYYHSWNIIFAKKNKKNKKSFQFYINAIFILIKSFLSLMTKKRENIIFTNSRNQDKNGRLFDIVSNDIITELQDNVLIVEKKKVLNKYKYKIEYNFVNLMKRIIPAKKLPVQTFNAINEIISENLNIHNITYKYLNNLYLQYQKEYIYYRTYFKWKRPKRIFFILNEIQKGLVAAAQSLQIPVFEMQHAAIDRTHAAYSYPNIITKNDNRVIIADYLLTFSDYWSNGFNIPTKALTIGNNIFAKKLNKTDIQDNSILFISSIIHGDYLSPIAIQYAQKHPNIEIKYKLHANEFKTEWQYKELFKNQKNISVIKNETPIDILIAKSKLVVLINSTVLYEALQMSTKVAIYKTMNYDTQFNCFKLPNVYLFDTTEELHEAYISEKQETNIVFFEQFNREVFMNFITKIK
jgi:hypothetical protein